MKYSAAPTPDPGFIWKRSASGYEWTQQAFQCAEVGSQRTEWVSPNRQFMLVAKSPPQGGKSDCDLRFIKRFSDLHRFAELATIESLYRPGPDSSELLERITKFANDHGFLTSGRFGYVTKVSSHSPEVPGGNWCADDFEFEGEPLGFWLFHITQVKTLLHILKLTHEYRADKANANLRAEFQRIESSGDPLRWMSSTVSGNRYPVTINSMIGTKHLIDALEGMGQKYPYLAQAGREVRRILTFELQAGVAPLFVGRPDDMAMGTGLSLCPTSLLGAIYFELASVFIGGFREFRLCAHCREPFVLVHKRRKFCSDSCKSMAHQARLRDQRAK